MKNNNQKQYNKSVYVYINPLQNQLTQVFFFFVFYNVYSLTFKGPQTTTPIQSHSPIHPTIRDKSQLAISTQLHIFIFTYTYTKRQKLSNLYCQKISLSHKTHNTSQTISIEYEIEKKRERVRAKMRQGKGERTEIP